MAGGLSIRLALFATSVRLERDLQGTGCFGQCYQHIPRTQARIGSPRGDREWNGQLTRNGV